MREIFMVPEVNLLWLAVLVLVMWSLKPVMQANNLLGKFSFVGLGWDNSRPRPCWRSANCGLSKSVAHKNNQLVWFLPQIEIYLSCFCNRNNQVRVSESFTIKLFILTSACFGSQRPAIHDQTAVMITFTSTSKMITAASDMEILHRRVTGRFEVKINIKYFVLLLLQIWFGFSYIIASTDTFGLVLKHWFGKLAHRLQTNRVSGRLYEIKDFENNSYIDFQYGRE